MSSGTRELPQLTQQFSDNHWNQGLLKVRRFAAFYHLWLKYKWWDFGFFIICWTNFPNKKDFETVHFTWNYRWIMKIICAFTSSGSMMTLIACGSSNIGQWLAQTTQFSILHMKTGNNKQSNMFVKGNFTTQTYLFLTPRHQFQDWAAPVLLI